jgi:multiple sugar transport system substrate-binding protein
MTGTGSLSRRSVLRLGGAAALSATVGGLSAGCGGSSATKKDAGGPMQYMFWGSTGEQKAITAMLQGFEKKQGGGTIQPLFTPGDFDTKLNALIASNRAPDVTYLSTPMAYRIAQEGKLVNIAQYFDKYPQLRQRLPETFYWWDEEHTLGTQSANEVMLLWHNKKAFREAGAELPPTEAGKAWSWDQFVAAATKLTVDQSGKRPDQSGFNAKKVKRFGTLAPTGSLSWYGLLLSAGVDFLDEAGTKTMINSGEAIKIFQNIMDLMYVHRVAPTPTQLGNNAPGLSVQLTSDRVAMAIDGQWALLDIAQTKTDYGIGVLPSYGTPMSVSVGGPTAIFTSTKHLERALELYLYEADPTASSLFTSGLWMPLEKKYYTDPAAIDLWTKNKAHPAEYKTAVIDYTLNHSKAYFYQKTKNIEAVDKLLVPAVEQMQTGKNPPAKVLNALAAKLNNGVLKGRFPTPSLS